MSMENKELSLLSSNSNKTIIMSLSFLDALSLIFNTHADKTFIQFSEVVNTFIEKGCYITDVTTHRSASADDVNLLALTHANGSRNIKGNNIVTIFFSNGTSEFDVKIDLNDDWMLANLGEHCTSKRGSRFGYTQSISHREFLGGAGISNFIKNLENDIPFTADYLPAS